ncbi:hypothetical protein C1H46_037521 [Malus baccata]|uniref:BRCT domain-containing protein n=1 Tax=Malus baccata TaxID=106549 RepID=A0A540KRU2_MALBA|nr:hypothetical protein C1H46_037521 [Malus baccata]
MVGLMGAQFSKPLVAKSLISYATNLRKYEIAKKFPKMKLVNHRWLEDCCATGSSATWEELDDQIVLFIWSKRSRLPFSDIVKDLFESAGGFSLSATHKTISGKFLYHVPKYRKLPAEKRPNSKLAQEETKLFVPVIDCNGEMVSTAVENSKTRK